MLQIVISDLLQMSHPGYRLTKLDRILTEKELPTFLDYINLVYQRFEYYMKENASNGLTNGALMMDMVECLKTLSEEDEPSIVFPTRIKLKSVLPLFDDECERMGKCFTNPPFVKEFYNQLASTMTQASKALMGEIEEESV